LPGAETATTATAHMGDQANGYNGKGWEPRP